MEQHQLQVAVVSSVCSERAPTDEGKREREMSCTPLSRLIYVCAYSEDDIYICRRLHKDNG